MVSGEKSLGIVDTSDATKRIFAKKSFEWTISKATPRGKICNELFTEYIAKVQMENNKKLEEEKIKKIHEETKLPSNLSPVITNGIDNVDNRLNTPSSYDFLTTNFVLFVFIAGFAYVINMVISSVE